MLTPSQYEHLCDQLTELYARLDESIIEDITRRMMKTGYVTDTAKWQAQQLQEAGLLYEDILSEIAKHSTATQQHVKSLFEDAGVASIRNDNRYYQAAGLEGIVKMSDRTLQTLNAGYLKCQGDLSNLTLTTANAAQQAYLNACNLAYMQVTSGTLDYNTAIRRAIQSAAKDGSSVLYPSGHRDKLDVAVRRSVLTGIGQTVRQLSLNNARDMDCDIMELTAHAGARPEHAKWQGKLVSLSGKRGYLTLKDIGYGEADGFGGINCRHDWHPFFLDYSQPAYSEKRLQELNQPHIKIGDNLYTDYEVSQMQRALERNIREKKRQVSAAHACVESAQSDIEAKFAQEDFQKASVKLKKAEQNLKDFLKQTGFQNDSSRTWVNGFGRSISQKAVWTNKKVLTSGTKNAILNSRDGNSRYKPVTEQAIKNMPKLVLFKTDRMNTAYQKANQDLLREVANHPELPTGTEFSIIYDAKMNRILGYDYIIGRVGSVPVKDPGVKFHAFHNHPSGETFSFIDIYNFAHNSNMLTFTATGNAGNIYCIAKLKTSDIEGYINYLNEKTKEIFYSTDGIDFSYHFISNGGNILYQKLNAEQQAELTKALVKWSYSCVEGAEKYGVKYISSKVAY